LKKNYKAKKRKKKKINRRIETINTTIKCDAKTLLRQTLLKKKKR